MSGVVKTNLRRWIAPLLLLPVAVVLVQVLNRPAIERLETARRELAQAGYPDARVGKTQRTGAMVRCNVSQVRSNRGYAYHWSADGADGVFCLPTDGRPTRILFDQAPVTSVDEQAVLPDGAPDKARYVRRYSLREVRIGEDTPYFTTQGALEFDAPRRVWVGVYTLPGDLEEDGRPGATYVPEQGELPTVFHGGCSVVNLVADPDDGRTLASWCNVDDRPGASRWLPSYVRP